MGILKPIQLEDVITRFVLALVAEKNGERFVCGSATIIHQHLALTAKHILHRCFERFEKPEALKTSRPNGSFALTAYQFFGEDKTINKYSIQKIWARESTDIAILKLEPEHIQRTKRLSAAQLTLHLPSKRSSVNAFGYDNALGNVEVEKISDQKLKETFSIQPVESSGTVLKHYVNGIEPDKYPCFKFDAEAKSGMSGGPVIDKFGSVCGIITSGGTKFSDSPKHYTVASTFEPLLDTPLNLPLQNHAAELTYPFRYLVKQGIISLRTELTDQD